MSVPFRELFVELPRAVFEVLQGIGEEAARAAGGVADTSSMAGAFKAAYRRRPSLYDASGERHLRVLMETFGWRDVELRRAVDRDEMQLFARLSCGHWQGYPIAHRAVLLCRTARDEVELLDRIVDSTERQCYCVQRAESAI